MAPEIAGSVKEFEQSLKQPVVAVKSEKKKKLKKSKRHKAGESNPNSAEHDLLVSIHSQQTCSSVAPHSVVSDDLLMNGPHDLNQREKHKKRKKNRKRELAESRSGSLRLAGPKRDCQPDASILPSEECFDDFHHDRKLPPSENNHQRLERNDNSFRSTESSIFSSHPTSQAQTQYAYKNGRSSLLDDAESCIGGVIASDADSWAGFPSSSRGIDFPVQSASGVNHDNEHAPSIFSVDTTVHASEPGQSGEKTSEWNPFFHQEESSYVASTVLSSRTKASGESTLETKNIASGTSSSRFPIPNIIMQQKAEEAARSATDRIVPSKRPRPKSQNQLVNSGINPQRSRIDQEKTDEPMQNDMLVRYLQSMGTSFRTSLNIATSFRDHQVNGSVATSPARASSPFSPVLMSSTKPSRRSDLSLGDREGTNISNNGGGQPRRGHRSIARRSQQARLWERSMEPGAVQMEGRAFGAPVRPELPARATGDETLLVEAVEAMAVDDLEHGPMIYAESSPLSWKDLLREKSIRRRIFIMCFIVVIAVVISVSLVAVKGPVVTSANGIRRNYSTHFVTVVGSHIHCSRFLELYC